MANGVAFVAGFALAFSGGYLGSGILTGSRALQPTNPLPLAVLIGLGSIAEIAAAVYGFWLFGWWWLLLFMASALAAGWLADRSRNMGSAPGLAALYTVAGLALLSWGIWG